MSLSHSYGPFHPPFFTFDDISHFFDSAWEFGVPSTHRELSRRDQPSSTSRILRPRMDLRESKDTGEMIATVELPGMTKEDVNIDVHQNRLIVSGQSAMSEEQGQEQEGYAVRERRFGRFSRTMPLPTDIEPEDIKANMENGVLVVRFPKSHPDQEPKKIAIH